MALAPEALPQHVTHPRRTVIAQPLKVLFIKGKRSLSNDAASFNEIGKSEARMWATRSLQFFRASHGGLLQSLLTRKNGGAGAPLDAARRASSSRLYPRRRCTYGVSHSGCPHAQVSDSSADSSALRQYSPQYTSAPS